MKILSYLHEVIMKRLHVSLEVSSLCLTYTKICIALSWRFRLQAKEELLSRKSNLKNRLEEVLTKDTLYEDILWFPVLDLEHVEAGNDPLAMAHEPAYTLLQVDHFV